MNDFIKLMPNRLLCCIFIFNTFQFLHGANHWIVTQTGKVEPHLESPFNLRRPYDLLALLEQEARWNDVNELYANLVDRKEAIEKKWRVIEKSSSDRAKVRAQDSECLTVGKHFSDINLYSTIASNGSERGIVFDFFKKKPENDKVVPVCNNFNKNKRMSSLMNGTNIILPPDDVLVKRFLPSDLLDDFGTYVSLELMKNSTSWVYYNLASFYWRAKGDGNEAIDCLKLAIQFVTEGYHDIPLYNLAGILHHSRHSRDAAQILHSAIDLAPQEPMHYFAIANIYAVLREYDKSIQFYDKYLELVPNHKEALDNRKIILCYFKLEKALIGFQSDLQGILNDLHEYHSLQQKWLRLQERMLWEHASFNYNFEGIRPDKTSKVQRCIQKTSGESKTPIISCDFYEKSPDISNLNLHNLHQLIENEKEKLNEQLQGVFRDVMKTTHMTVNENLYFDSAGWPSKEECAEWNLPINEKDDLDLPVILLPDSKGYPIRSILSEYIGLAEGSQQDLPWYPPVCEGEGVNGEKYIPGNEKTILDTELKSNKYLKQQFLKYVNDGRADEAEIGQRIIIAMEKKVCPKWVLATMASMYWRVRGNARRAIDCLDMAFQSVPKDQTDMVLVPLASILHQLGLDKQSMKIATLAFKSNYVEPSTNFLLALLHYKGNNQPLAMYYMKNVLRVDHEFYDGLAVTLLKTWACRGRLGTGSTDLKPKELNEQMCSKSESSKDAGCPKGDASCKSATLYCYKKSEMDIDGKGGVDCRSNMEESNLGQAIISSLLAAEGSGDVEPDQSKLESFNEQGKFLLPHVHHHVHMRLSLGEQQPFGERNGLNDFFVSVALSDSPDVENHLHVYDRYGTYMLSSSICHKTDVSEALKYSSVWPSIVSRTLDLTSSLKSASNQFKDARPYCMRVSKMPMPYDLDELTERILNDGLPDMPDNELLELLALMAGNQKLSVNELGFRIAATLKQDETDWVMLTASAIYWMIIGDSEQSLICLRAALTQVPDNSLDIPSIYLAHLLNKAGLYREALSVANVALKTYPNFILNHFMVANIYISAGENEKAVGFLRACLSLDSNFEPARTKLKALLCKILFDDSSTSPTNVAQQIVDVLN